jgi:hypothetical protein
MSNTGYLDLNSEEIIGLVLVIFGIPTVYFSFNDGRRDKLFWASVLFLVGIVFIVKARYELLDSRGLIFTSILYIGGAAFFLLFVDNIKEKAFLFTAILLLASGYASTTIFKHIGIINLANKLAEKAQNFWPAILILFGLSIFLNRKK